MSMVVGPLRVGHVWYECLGGVWEEGGGVGGRKDEEEGGKRVGREGGRREPLAPGRAPQAQWACGLWSPLGGMPLAK